LQNENLTVKCVCTCSEQCQTTTQMQFLHGSKQNVARTKSLSVSPRDVTTAALRPLDECAPGK